ncbi:MAG: lysophospholipid acyltransferase family protein [Acidobacteriota bacterium]
MFAALKMVFVFIALGAPAALVGIPWSAIRGDFSTMYAWGMGVIRLGLRAGGVKVRVVGIENVPEQACIFLSNHVSNMDPPVLLPVEPRMTSVFLKKELMKIPLLGTAMRMGKFVPVSRARSREEAQKSVEAAAEALRFGLNITVFPEGTRSPDGKLLPFKKGAFFLAAETRAPMVPVVIRGTAGMMRKGSLKVIPGTAVVTFLPAIWPAEGATSDELMTLVREALETELARGDAA